MRCMRRIHLIARQHEQRIRALDLIERVGESAGKISRWAARHQVHDHFGVAGGLKDRAAMLERAAPFRRARQVAVMPQSELALVAIDDDGLRVHQRGVAGGRVARVAERRVAGKPREHLGLKNIRHQPHGFFQMQFAPVARNDSRRFLAAMLQRVEAEIRELRGFGMAEDSTHATVIVETVVFDLNYRAHSAFRKSLPRRMRSSAPAQASVREGTSALTAARPFSSMRNSPRVTWPASSTATSYCAATRRMAARFSGVTDTTARAPRSPNSAASSGSLLVSDTRAERPSLAKQDSASVTARPPSLTSCADCSAPLLASATSSAISRFSPARSTAGCAPEHGTLRAASATASCAPANGSSRPQRPLPSLARASARFVPLTRTTAASPAPGGSSVFVRTM